MVVRAGGYYGAAFTGARGVMQGDPISTTIFNLVVDEVVNHWVCVMVEGVKKQGERGQEGRNNNVLFYAGDVMVVSSDLQRLQEDFSTLVVLFDRVGTRNNVRKTVGMVCRPSQTAGTQ